MITLFIVPEESLQSLMMQQSCNNALPLVGEELAYMKCNFCKIL